VIDISAYSDQFFTAIPGFVPAAAAAAAVVYFSNSIIVFACSTEIEQLIL